jgi:hypothetical protein
MSEMKKPESGGKPKKITGKGKPGGPRTPGARAEAGKSITEWAKEISDENKNGTRRSQ